MLARMLGVLIFSPCAPTWGMLCAGGGGGGGYHWPDFSTGPRHQQHSSSHSPALSSVPVCSQDMKVNTRALYTCNPRPYTVYWPCVMWHVLHDIHHDMPWHSPVISNNDRTWPSTLPWYWNLLTYFYPGWLQAAAWHLELWCQHRSGLVTVTRDTQQKLSTVKQAQHMNQRSLRLDASVSSV